MAEKKRPAKKKPAAQEKAVARKKPAKRAKAAPTKKNPGVRTRGGVDFPIVGIGASAGGLEALEALFSHMPCDCNIGFVVIQHLSRRHKSIMRSLLSKYTEMEVLDLEDGIEVKPNCVYVNPPNKNVVIMNGRLQLFDPVENAGINLPIDCFFRSMAEELAEKAICIILSGTATDGTMGLRAVKGGGGMVMVQDPASAKYDGMPRSAIATGLVDFILPAEELPDQLTKYVLHPYVEGLSKIKLTKGKLGIQVPKVFSLIRRATGHDFSHYKQNTIRRRIERRMAVHQISEIADYVHFLQKTPAEVDILFKDLLIGVTNFFRDPDAFNALKETAIPGLLKSGTPDFPVRVWVVGCSSGEEAYSIAILFAEVMDELKQHYNVQVFATDIDAQAIEYARTGIYPESIAADVSQARLNQFFSKEDNSYKVRQQIREMVVFAVQNIIKDPPFSRIDVLSCRNLLIYMDTEAQKMLLPICHYALNQDGILFLGPSESIGEFAHYFQPMDKKWKVFRRKDSATEKPPQYSGIPFRRRPPLVEGKEKQELRDVDIHGVAEMVVLEDYAPPGVLVNERYEIVHFIGKTDMYLEPPLARPALIY